MNSDSDRLSKKARGAKDLDTGSYEETVPTITSNVITRSKAKSLASAKEPLIEEVFKVDKHVEQLIKGTVPVERRSKGSPKSSRTSNIHMSLFGDARGGGSVDFHDIDAMTNMNVSEPDSDSSGDTINSKPATELVSNKGSKNKSSLGSIRSKGRSNKAYSNIGSDDLQYRAAIEEVKSKERSRCMAIEAKKEIVRMQIKADQKLALVLNEKERIKSMQDRDKLEQQSKLEIIREQNRLKMESDKTNNGSGG